MFLFTPFLSQFPLDKIVASAGLPGSKEIPAKNYDGLVRQVMVKGNGHEKPAMLITNDFQMPLELLVGNYARRWRVENGIAEAVIEEWAGLVIDRIRSIGDADGR